MVKLQKRCDRRAVVGGENDEVSGETTIRMVVSGGRMAGPLRSGTEGTGR